MASSPFHPSQLWQALLSFFNFTHLAAPPLNKAESPKFASIWDRPEFNKTEFAFNAYYLAIKDEQQRSEKVSNSDDSVNLSEQSPYTDEEQGALSDGDSYLNNLSSSIVSERKDEIERNFLDCLAELFAREKPLRSKEAKAIQRPKYEPDTAKQVTAAALEDVEVGRSIQVIMAKNGGFDEKDQKFAEFLFEWISIGSDGGQGEIEFIERVLVFSKRRSEHYIAMTCLKEMDWNDVKTLVKPCSLEDDKKMAIPQVDIDEIDRLFEICRKYANTHASTREETQLLHKITKSAYDLRVSRKLNQLARTLRRHQKEKEANYLDKLGLEVAFLGRVRDGIKSLQIFSNHYKSFEINYKFLEPPAFQRIDSTEFKSIVISLPGFSPARERLFRQLKNWHNEPPQDLPKVHCEMQLLLYFDDLNKARKPRSQYFGVSKKTCWMCNTLLESYGDYQVRGTHARRVGGWMIDSSNPSQNLLDALKLIQCRMLDEAFKTLEQERLFGENFFVSYKRATNRIEELIDRLQIFVESPSEAQVLRTILDELRITEGQLNDIEDKAWPKIPTQMQSSGGMARLTRREGRRRAQREQARQRLQAQGGDVQAL